MSFEALKWAFGQQPKKSTEKLVLLSLANCVNKKHVDLAFPSVKQISDDTQLNKKTIYAALLSLVEQEIIANTDQKVGRTGSVKVFKLNIEEYPKTGQLEREDIDEIEADSQDLSIPKNGSAKHTQKRVSSENEAYPKTDLSVPKNGPKRTQKRTQAYPKTGKGTSKEPVNNQERISKVYTDHSGKTDLDFSLWPTKPSEQIFLDWKSARKLKKQTLTQTVINTFGNEISKACEVGYSVDQCLSEVCARGWQGFRADWLTDKVKPIGQKKYSGFDQIDYQAQAEAEGFATELRL